jgi:hypothetical protein
MKAIIVMLLILLSACTTQTEYGKCVGINDAQKPNLVYKASGWNIAMSIIFFETVFVPIVVVMDDLYCPVDTK